MVLVTSALYLVDLDEGLVPGGEVAVEGEEAHHGVTVKRLAIGESVLLSDGLGRGFSGEVISIDKRRFVVRLEAELPTPAPKLAWTVVQALAKGDRSDLAVQMATELGARRIVAWQAARSIVRWQGERGDRALDKWRATAREAAKQSRRLWLPEVAFANTAAVARLVAAADIALILHEEAPIHLAQCALPPSGTGLIVVGPEGGIAPDEVDTLTAAGGSLVSISDAVLRTSTAAAVALGQLDALARR